MWFQDTQFESRSETDARKSSAQPMKQKKLLLSPIVSAEVDNMVDSRASSSDVVTFEGKPSATKVNEAQDDSILTYRTLSQTYSHAYSCVVASAPNYSAN